MIPPDEPPSLPEQPPPGLPDRPFPAPTESIGQDAGMRLLLPVGRSPWAIASGYLGLLSPLLLPAPLALGTGIFALIHINRSKGGPNPRHGMGRAIFGIIMGGLFTVPLVIMLVRIVTA